MLFADLHHSLLQKKPSYKLKVEGSKLTTDIYYKETDGWIGHLSAEIIHGREKWKQKNLPLSLSVLFYFIF